MMKKILTIAGSDCSGGAGIQADIKTITAHRMYAMSAVTALTAQNTTGVFAIMEATPEFVEQQLDCIFNDIRPDAVKIGMVSNGRIIEAIAEKLVEYDAENVVIDPVMVSTSGSALLSDDARQSLISTLLPLGNVITPNIPEAEVLSQMKIHNEEDMVTAARRISQEIGGAVLLKGGHSVSDANDLLFEKGDTYWFKAERILTENTHGTGCTLSSAIACNLADGMSLGESIEKAKEYLSGALAAGLNLGKGSGPVNHLWRL
ncbi:bifunctional hydroxymethylpyrimidine kinase/phosphomethylpyrimidine kinase [Desulforhopalus vacuolatus]|nr:bifunctional hydroxymethylpyrimidine kinase/phosphomethylpyrimidine kinase [Desulforhopalus vacuolatus]MBM9518982.1 bifunctional hydroxymethylpyrimidine kinase/phosphomethylpyrimidine kinase [Desulforhopalus vacuolatus]